MGIPFTAGESGARREGARRSVVLLVEDNAADEDLAREALDDAPHDGWLHVVRDGVEAMAFLRREGPYADAPSPDLVLLDLNLPRLDGRGVLAAMRRDAALRRIPVVVLTSSSAPDDAAAAYDAGANCYVTKPVELTAYLAAVRAIERFWLGVVTLPP